MIELPYTDLNSYLRARFGCRVQKITIDAGFSCPNRDGTLSRGGCIYCNQRGSGTGAYGKLSITGQIQSAQATIRKRFKNCRFIAYFQSFTNTYGPVEKLRSLYREALAQEDMAGLIIGTRPDCVADDVLDLVAEFSRQSWVTLEFGLQSVHDKTLERINRGHTFETFRNSVERARARGIEVGAHVILGLPGEGREEMLETSKTLGSMDIQGIKIHLLYVIKGTALDALYRAGEYQCLTRGEYTDIVCEFLGWLPSSIVIHRLTGDPRPDELTAPAWALEKQANLQTIRQTLAERGLHQGIYLK